MIHILDTNSFAVLKNIYPATFPQFWRDFDSAVAAGEIGSVEEVLNESEKRLDSEHLAAWMLANRGIFVAPGEEDMTFVTEMFAVNHFQQLVSQDVLLKGGFVADPWLIARARRESGCVVTEERLRPNAAKIPNVCDHFNVPWTNIEGLFRAKGWQY